MHAPENCSELFYFWKNNQHPICMYIFRLARAGLNLLSQTSDMNIDGSDISRIIIPPHQIQKILSVENLVRIRDQKFQQVKFLGRQIHFPIANKDSSAVQVNAHLSGNNGTLCRLFLLSSLCTTDDRLDTCLDLRILKGFRHIIIRAVFQSRILSNHHLWLSA